MDCRLARSVQEGRGAVSIAQILRVSARGVRRTIGEATGIAPAGNRLTVLPDDTYIVSYPRSGNTWLRFLLGNLLYDVTIDFSNRERYIPDIYRNSDRYMLKIARPRILKSHEMYDLRYPRVIYIIRDGRDIAVSYYYYQRKFHNYRKDFDSFIVDFVTGRIDNYGSWGANILSWLARKNDVKNGFLLVRYEDMLNDTRKVVGDVYRFLELSRSPEQIQEAIKKSAFNNMATLETKAENSDRKLRNSDHSIRFVRAGRSGSWQEAFTPYSKEVFKELLGEMLIKLEYENSLEW